MTWLRKWESLEKSHSNSNCKTNVDAMLVCQELFDTLKCMKSL